MALDFTKATQLAADIRQRGITDANAWALALEDLQRQEQQAANAPKGRAKHPVWRACAGITITTDQKPSEPKNARTRDLIKLTGRMGFTHARFLLNHEEAAEQYKLLRAGSPDCLTTLALQNGMIPVYDSADAMIPAYNAPTVKDAIAKNAAIDLKVATLFQRIRALGFQAVYINDADRKALAPRLKDIVQRIRDVSDLPLVASLTGTNFDPLYADLFDWREFQTFEKTSDNKADEFRGTFDKIAPEHFLCIDAQKSATPGYLADLLPQAIDNDLLWIYTAYDSAGTNFLEQPDTVKAYTAFLGLWRKAHGLITL